MQTDSTEDLVSHQEPKKGKENMAEIQQSGATSGHACGGSIEQGLASEDQAQTAKRNSGI